jgi:hypothetical protein
MSGQRLPLISSGKKFVPERSFMALVLVVVCFFFGYVFFWSAKSTLWIAQISLSSNNYHPSAGLQIVNSYSLSVSYLMEYSAWLGLLARSVGASFALLSAIALMKTRGAFSLQALSRVSTALFLEGMYFFSLIPSIYYLLGFSSLPLTSRICLSTGLALQMVLISPALIRLSLKLRRARSESKSEGTERLAILAALSYVIALYATYWTKWVEMSFIEGIRWLLSPPVVFAFANTAFSFTLAVVFAVSAARRTLKGDFGRSRRLWGASLFFLSLHLIVFVVYCFSVNAAWMALFSELWMIPMMGMAFCFLLGGHIYVKRATAES